MNGVYLRKYGVQATINFELFEVDGIDFRSDAVHASGDTKISKNETAEANTANGFTDEGQGYSLVLSAAEMQAARIVIYVVDQTVTKLWLDRVLIIETYGHVSAQHAFDFDAAINVASGIVESNLKQIDGQATNGTNATLNLKQLNIDNSAGSAIVAQSSGSNGAGIVASGQGSGEGIRAIGGATGSGIKGSAGGAGSGIEGVGGSASGPGIKGSAQANNDAGMELVKHGTGKDIDADEIDGIKSRTDNLPETPKKNTAFTNPYQFFMEDSTGTGVPGLTVTGIRILDGNKTGIAAPITEVVGGGGWYQITPLAGDTNGDHVSHQFSTVTVGVKDSIVEFWTAT